MNKELLRQFRESVKKGKELGRVSDVSEAFKRYPVENEAHKGKMEYFIAEEENNK